VDATQEAPVGEPRKVPGGDLVRKATRVTTSTAVAATEVMVMSIQTTGRALKRLVPKPPRRNLRSVDED
jgi:hypothetical protein